MYFRALSTYMIIIIISFCGLTFYILKYPTLSLVIFVFKSIMADNIIATAVLCMVYFFPSFHFQPIYGFESKVHNLQTAISSWVF